MNDPSAIWTRDTPWRQGHVLRMDTVDQLKLFHPESPEATCVVVISHDCDLANDNLKAEPNVEVIIGRFPVKADGNFFWAKAPRTLHLEAHRDASPVMIELVATAKHLIPKRELTAFSPDASFSLTPQARDALRSWLKIRYDRAAFPDAFVNRLTKSETDKRFAKLLEPTNDLISGVFFVVDGGREVDHSDGTPYELSIVLLYPPGEDPEATADEVETVAEKVEKLFADRHFDAASKIWKGIAVKQCMSISEDELTVAKRKLLTEWRLEHMTLRADASAPPQPKAL